ncbi:Uncharacterised protein [Kingella potus]|uniref:Uncharacterized protein n=1 Tax=Kingella potus TaxID=265175 RepID=A0A377R4C0_9NEIS|nr:hypothetical protein [Kingella potus]STR02395.1 Uncharacterised protein [Kingella potus]
MGFQNQRFGIGIAFGRVVHAFKVFDQRVGNFHFQHAPLDFFGLPAGQYDFKGADFVFDRRNAENCWRVRLRFSKQYRSPTFGSGASTRW